MRKLNLTHQTKQVIVEDSWHSIQIYRPDVVIESIKQSLNKESDENDRSY